jgi:hypothetical protein
MGWIKRTRFIVVPPGESPLENPEKLDEILNKNRPTGGRFGLGTIMLILVGIGLVFSTVYAIQGARAAAIPTATVTPTITHEPTASPTPTITSTPLFTSTPSSTATWAVTTTPIVIYKPGASVQVPVTRVVQVQGPMTTVIQTRVVYVDRYYPTATPQPTYTAYPTQTPWIIYVEVTAAETSPTETAIQAPVEIPSATPTETPTPSETPSS